MNSGISPHPDIQPSHIVEASRRIDGHAVRTPLVISEPMSLRCGSTIVIKTEHRQRTGSFKIRGALNKVFGLSEDRAGTGVITASSGNHGIGVATAAAARGIACTVYLPAHASTSKIDAIKRLGATIVTVDDPDTAAAERLARTTASERDVTFISPYNDLDVVAGQGTIGKEIAEDWDAVGVGPLDAIVVAVGGGGLISGIATWLKSHRSEIVVVGASPENDQAMAASVAAGEIIEPPAHPTFSDGTAGALEAGSVTFELCRSLVDRWLTIDERGIALGVKAMIDDHHELIEGSAGLAIAAAQRYGAENPGSSIAVVSCGANVSSAALGRMLDAADR